jgi:hypothetical protein
MLRRKRLPDPEAQLKLPMREPACYTRHASTPYLEQLTETLLGEMESVRVP